MIYYSEHERRLHGRLTTLYARDPSPEQRRQLKAVQHALQRIYKREKEREKEK